MFHLHSVLENIGDSSKVKLEGLAPASFNVIHLLYDILSYHAGYIITWVVLVWQKIDSTSLLPVVPRYPRDSADPLPSLQTLGVS